MREILFNIAGSGDNEWDDRVTETDGARGWLKMLESRRFGWKKFARRYRVAISAYGVLGCSRSQIRSCLIRVAGAFARPSFNESEIMPGVPRRRDINHALARYVRNSRRARPGHNGSI